MKALFTYTCSLSRKVFTERQKTFIS